MEGRAVAPAAGTVLNALATGTGSAFAIDLETTATVTLDPDHEGVAGRVADHPDAETALIERCVERVVERFGDGEGGTVETESEVPMAAGLKSSSAAANAATLAALDALEVPVGPHGRIDRVEACRIGVDAARETGVTVTGAFDDASASMLGGVTVTDNAADELLAREAVEWSVLVWTPPERAFSADADVEACRQVAPVADHVADLALDGRYGLAMTLNGLAFSAALEFPAAPLLTALGRADGASLSGTGPSYVAVGDRTALESLRSDWSNRDGTTWLTTTRTDGTRRR
jgi:shikimate kinase